MKTARLWFAIGLALLGTAGATGHAAAETYPLHQVK
jgi:hypothetical protein